ncbi:MAG: YjbF family lipoprotein [Marinibacterium sp.]
MRSRQRIAVAGPLALAGLLALTACTSESDGTPDTTSAAVRAAQVFAGGFARETAPEPVPLTRAVLDTIDGEFIEAMVEKTGSRAFLYISGERRGARAGDEGGRLLVWRTENAVSLTTRDGVLTATRGLGNDMISGTSGAIRASLAARAPGQGARLQIYSALDNKAVRLDLACEIADLGRETITIVERRHVTDHFRETCEAAAGGGVVVNEYWIDSAGPIVWQSRQWAGPYIGYVQIRQVTP